MEAGTRGARIPDEPRHALEANPRHLLPLLHHLSSRLVAAFVTTLVAFEVRLHVRTTIPCAHPPLQLHGPPDGRHPLAIRGFWPFDQRRVKWTIEAGSVPWRPHCREAAHRGRAVSAKLCSRLGTPALLLRPVFLVLYIADSGRLQHGVNMRTSLTTFDGYPRDDIDVPQGA